MPLHDQKYQSHSLRRLQRRKKFQAYLFVTALLTLLIGASYVVIGSHLFRIDRIIITDIEPIHHQAILDALRPRVIASSWRGVLGMDHFWVWGDEIAFSDTRIRAVRVKKDLTKHELTLTAVPRERYLIWCRGLEQARCYWVDRDGIAFMEAPTTAGQLVLTASENEASVLVLGEPVVLPSQFEVISKILEGVRTIGIAHTGAVLDRSLQELHLKAVSGTKMLFSIRFDPEKTALPGLAEFSKSPGLSTLNYVDFTVENRAFYQPK